MFCLPFLGPLHTAHGLKHDQMHFWIDKRSGLNGRRVPASLSSGRTRRRNKSLITPVHRCQSLENGHSSRHIPTCSSPQRAQPYTTPTISYNTSRQQQPDTETRLSMETSAEGGAPTRPHSMLKYWMAGILVFLVMSIMVNKFYSDGQHSKIDISVASSMTLLAAVMLVCVIFIYTRYKGTPQDYNTREATETTNQYPNFGGLEGPARPEVSLNYMLMDMSLPTPQPPQTTTVAITPGPSNEAELPPPPYHLAVLLPPPEPIITAEEAPPPTYDKAVVR